MPTQPPGDGTPPDRRTPPHPSSEPPERAGSEGGPEKGTDKPEREVTRPGFTVQPPPQTTPETKPDPASQSQPPGSDASLPPGAPLAPEAPPEPAETAAQDTPEGPERGPQGTDGPDQTPSQAPSETPPETPFETLPETPAETPPADAPVPPAASSAPPAGAEGIEEPARANAGTDAGTGAPRASRAPTSTHVTNSPIEVEPGTQIIGTYEILEHINTGGMGEVYRGVNIHNDEIVAIKVVLPALAHDRKILALFQKESTVLRRLAHEAIVRYEVFTIDPGISRPCLVMEYVDGQPLTDIIDAGPMPVERVLRLLRRVASGLDTAHRAGVVHRDLSPDNVILPDGDVEHAKIIDFGIAKAATPGGGTLIGGQFAGKYAYVAPEQFGWYDGVVTGQADVYSLGLLAAALARGAPLEMGSNLAEAVRSRTSVPDLEGVPEELRPLLSRMLEPDPANRAESMAEVLATVQTMLGGQTSVPPGAGTSAPPAGSVPPGAGVQQSVPPGAWAGQSVPPSGAGNATVLASAPSVPPPGAGAPGPSGSAAPGQVQTTPPGAGDSPFGTSTDAPTQPPGGAAETPRKRSAVPAILLSIVLVGAAAAGGAWYAWLLPLDDVPAPAAEAPVTDSDEQIAWIAGAEPVDECAYVQVAGVDAAANTIALQGFGPRAVAFNPLLADFAETHGYRPNLTFTPARDGQCSVLEFLNDLRAVGPRVAIGGLDVRLDQETLAEGDTLSGSAEGAAGEVTSLLIFDRSGAMQNLSHRVLRDGADTVRFTQPDLRFHEQAQPDPDTAENLLILLLNSDLTLDTINLIGRGVALPASELPNFWRFVLSDAEGGDEAISATLAAVPLSAD